jgi:hypothetical protein
LLLSSVDAHDDLVHERAEEPLAALWTQAIDPLERGQTAEPPNCVLAGRLGVVEGHARPGLGQPFLEAGLPTPDVRQPPSDRGAVELLVQEQIEELLLLAACLGDLKG